MSQIDTDLSATPPADLLVAQPDPGYRWKHLIVSAALIALGCWFAYDGLVRWPAENDRIKQVEIDKDKATDSHDTAKMDELAKELSTLKRHSSVDLLLQVASWRHRTAVGRPVLGFMDPPRHPRPIPHGRQHAARPRPSADHLRQCPSDR